MKAIALSDIHGRTENLQKIVQLIHNRGVELALIAGDLTNYGGKRQAEEVLNILEGLEVMAVPGNLDTAEVLGFLEEKGISLHGKKKRLGKWAFTGFGGGLLGQPGEVAFGEEKIEKALLGLLESGKNSVLLTHLPPFGTSIDLAENRMHIGSKAIMKIIEKKQPLLHICGHCHDAQGEEKIGKTTSANAGAVKEGMAMVIDFEKGLKLEWIQV